MDELTDEHAAAVLADYLAVWNTPDPGMRATLLQRCWPSSAAYVDPNVDLLGPSELDAHVAGLHDRRPGARIEIVGGVNVHHRWASFAWRVVLTDGSVPVSGIDTVEFAADGRLAHVIGFFGGAPPWPA